MLKSKYFPNIQVFFQAIEKMKLIGKYWVQ